MKRGFSVDSVLKPLSEVPFQAYMSNVLQTADILDWVLAQVGVAEVWLTSFSISEEFLRRLFFIRQKHLVSEIHLLLDFKATHKTLSLLPFMKNAVDSVHLADNHSKVLLVKAADYKVSVITSQNLTRGNRHEAACISSDNLFFDVIFDQVNALINNNSVKIDDLF